MKLVIEIENPEVIKIIANAKNPNSFLEKIILAHYKDVEVKEEPNTVSKPKQQVNVTELMEKFS